MSPWPSFFLMGLVETHQFELGEFDLKPGILGPLFLGQHFESAHKSMNTIQLVQNTTQP